MNVLGYNIKPSESVVGVGPNGSKLRELARKVATDYYFEPIDQLAEFYYYQWGKFIKPEHVIVIESAKNVIKDELDRNFNLILSDKLKQAQSSERSEEYLNSLLRKRKITVSELRKQLSEMKNE